MGRGGDEVSDFFLFFFFFTTNPNLKYFFGWGEGVGGWGGRLDRLSKFFLQRIQI